MKKKVAIVGAGVGGLSTAARLASRGHTVEVFEKLPRCGGRNNIVEVNGFKFDTGPSFVLMPDFFEEVFSYCGENIKDHLDLRALDPGYKIIYADGDELTVELDSERTKANLERFETGAADKFDSFIRETAGIYEAVRPLLFTCFTTATLADPKYWPLITKIRALDTYWGLAKRYFRSEKLCYAFTFEAMFMGVSPFIAPAFYSIISYTDHVQKIFHPMGGMYQIPLSLEKIAKKHGAVFHYDTEIARIEEKDGRLVLGRDHIERDFDNIVVNADFAYTQTDLLKRRIPKFKYSCSVYLMYLGLKRKVDGFAHHNLFFASDLRKNLKQIFDTYEVPGDPSFYVHVPTVTDPSLAPEGKEIFYILVPVPNLERGDNFLADEAMIRRSVFDRISAKLGQRLEDLIEVEERFYPADFIGKYNIKNGATFGLSHNLMQSAFFRPANFDRKIDGLYYAGASTQPGGGLPVVMAGSRIVADMIQAGER